MVPDDLQAFPNVRVARIERILEEPAVFLEWITAELGIETSTESLEEAAAALGGGAWEFPPQPMGRAQVLVEVVGGDVLDNHDYPAVELSTARKLAARTEMAVADETLGVLQRIREAGTQTTERLVKSLMRWRNTLDTPEDS